MSQNTVNVRLVTRNATEAEWLQANPVLLKGEMAISTDKNLIKVGDGTTTWDQLSYINDLSTVVANHYEGIAAEGETDIQVIDRVLAAASATAEKDDTFVVKRVISGSKNSYTAYVYNGTAWAAMDGNYDASNVYFDKDFVATAPIGVVTIPSSGSTTITAAGKSVKDVLAGILAKEEQPAVTNPSVSVTAAANKAYEVGTKVSPTYTASLNPGSYTYGPATGITAKAWEVTNSATSEKLTTATGTFAEITVGDGTSYTITAKATYEDGAMPKTNIGNDAPTKQIKAGSASATSSAKVTGYRNFFYGAVNTSTAEAPITSVMIRGLTKGGAYNSSKTLPYEAAQVSGAKRVIVAVPANSTRAGLSQVLLPSTLNADITADFVLKDSVNVEGDNGYQAIAYKVWVYEPAVLDSSEKYTITLA